MLGGGEGLFTSPGALRVGALSVSLLCLRPWESPKPPCQHFCTPPSGCFPFEARVCRVPVLGDTQPRRGVWKTVSLREHPGLSRLLGGVVRAGPRGVDRLPPPTRALPGDPPPRALLSSAQHGVLILGDCPGQSRGRAEKACPSLKCLFLKIVSYEK